jgi:hypothetical protein
VLDDFHSSTQARAAAMPSEIFRNAQGHSASRS